MGRDDMETIHIPIDAERIISTSSKGDQSKWRIGNKWVKQNARSYEGQAEVHASLDMQVYNRWASCVKHMVSWLMMKFGFVLKARH